MKPSAIETCFSELADTALCNHNEPLALATVIQAVSPTSGNPGDKALISSDKIVEGWVGGGCAQSSVIEAARNVLNCGEPCIIRVGPKGEWQPLEGVVDFTSGCLSGGTLVIFIEPLVRQPKLCILGDSPVALSLSAQAGMLGFSVLIAGPDIDPDQLADTVTHMDDFSNIDGDFLVIATQGKHDRAALKAALESHAGYISLVASEKKTAGLKAGLAKSGVEPDSLGRIHGPAGIDIGAQTPAEIALSILADIVRLRRTVSAVRNKPASQQKSLEEAVETVSSGCCNG